MINKLFRCFSFSLIPNIENKGDIILQLGADNILAVAVYSPVSGRHHPACLVDIPLAGCETLCWKGAHLRTRLSLLTK